DGQHAVEQVAHLVWRVVEEFGNDVDGAGRLHDRNDEQQIQRKAQQALPHRVAMPLTRKGGKGLRTHASSPAGARSRRTLRPLNSSARDTLSSRIARSEEHTSE